MYSVHYTLRQIFKKFPSDKVNGAKSALFFHSRAPSHPSYTLQLITVLKHKALLSKTLRGIFHFRFPFVFIKIYIFGQQNAWTL